MQIDENTGLVYFNINKINKCETKTFCIKLSPKYKKFIAGEYISYFGLTMRNARVKTKQLFLFILLHIIFGIIFFQQSAN